MRKTYIHQMPLLLDVEDLRTRLASVKAELDDLPLDAPRVELDLPAVRAMVDASLELAEAYLKLTRRGH